MTADQTTRPLDVVAIRAHTEAATPGPWEPGLEIDGVYAGRRTVVRSAAGQRLLSVGQTRSHDAEHAEANAEFAAHARTDVPALLAEVERLRAQLGDAMDTVAADGKGGVADKWAGAFEAYLKRRRDAYPGTVYDHHVLDSVLDDFRDHLYTGTPLDQDVQGPTAPGEQ